MRNEITADKKPNCISSIVLGIVGLALSPFVPGATYACSITGLVRAFKKRNEKNITIGIVLNIIALCIAVINSIMGIVLTIKLFNKGKKKDSVIEDYDDVEEDEEDYDIV